MQCTVGLSAVLPFGSTTKRNSVAKKEYEKGIGTICKQLNKLFNINIFFLIVKFLLFFRILKHESIIFANGNGSSVINRTRSRLTLAKSNISLNNKVQYGFIVRPSICDRSPPTKFIDDIDQKVQIQRNGSEKFTKNPLSTRHCQYKWFTFGKN